MPDSATATAIANLKTRQSDITAILAAGQTADGQSLNRMTVIVEDEEVKADDYVKRLFSELESIVKLLEKYETSPAFSSGTPWETETEAR